MGDNPHQPPCDTSSQETAPIGVAGGASQTRCHGFDHRNRQPPESDEPAQEIRVEVGEKAWICRRLLVIPGFGALVVSVGCGAIRPGLGTGIAPVPKRGRSGRRVGDPKRADPEQVTETVEVVVVVEHTQTGGLSRLGHSQVSER